MRSTEISMYFHKTFKGGQWVDSSLWDIHNAFLYDGSIHFYEVGPYTKEDFKWFVLEAWDLDEHEEKEMDVRWVD